MQTANIVGFLRGQNYKTGRPVAQLLIELPDGPTLTLDVEPAYLNRFFDGKEQEVPPKNEEPVQESQKVTYDTALSALSEPPTEVPEGIAWEDIDNTLLPLQVKCAMVEHGLPAVLPVENIRQIRDKLIECLTPAEWHAIGSKYNIPVVIPSRPPQLNAVTFQEGSAVMPSVRSITVPKDEMGYPIVPQSAHQAGPVERSPEDDDGVPQV